jgi:hypothetical protein
MNLTTARQELADALSTIEGLNGTPYRPVVIKGGSAWPLLASAERECNTWQLNWSILICLGQDEKVASLATDAILPQLMDALDELAFITAVSPVGIDTGSGTLLGLQITAHSEGE